MVMPTARRRATTVINFLIEDSFLGRDRFSAYRRRCSRDTLASRRPLRDSGTSLPRYQRTVALFESAHLPGLRQKGANFLSQTPLRLEAVAGSLEVAVSRDLGTNPETLPHINQKEKSMRALTRVLFAIAVTVMLTAFGGPTASAETGWYCSPVRGDYGDLLGICCATTQEEFRRDCPQTPQAQ